MSTVDDVYARMDDLVPPTAIEIEDAFLGAVFERDRLAARLAEVEGKLETAEGEAYYWRSLCSEDDRVEQLQRRLAEVEAENARLRELALVEAEGQHDEMLGATALAAERDRLAQELEDAVEAMRKAARGPSPASAVTGFLARFPVKEGDGNG